MMLIKIKGRGRDNQRRQSQFIGINKLEDSSFQTNQRKNANMNLNEQEK